MPVHWVRRTESARDKADNCGSAAQDKADNYVYSAHLVELNAANRISKGLSNQKWRVVLVKHCEVHYALPFLTGSSYSDAVGGVSLY
ncbi:hypothetical protein J6590_042630 [Homalodisca vitripennis]|nr:hypothetical protein J6590_042630 [Homalodisca vitripennis]